MSESVFHRVVSALLPAKDLPGTGLVPVTRTELLSTQTDLTEVTKEVVANSRRDEERDIQIAALEVRSLTLECQLTQAHRRLRVVSWALLIVSAVLLVLVGATLQ